MYKFVLIHFLCYCSYLQFKNILCCTFYGELSDYIYIKISNTHVAVKTSIIIKYSCSLKRHQYNKRRRMTNTGGGYINTCDWFRLSQTPRRAMSPPYEL